MCVAVLQIGVVPPHCALVKQGTQVAVGASHTGVAPLQRVALVAEHWAQAPDVWQAGVDPPHSLSPPHARQVCVLRLQIGVAPPHCAFVVQGTQSPDGA